LLYCTTALNSKISPNPSLPKRGNKRWLCQRGEIRWRFAKEGEIREEFCQRWEIRGREGFLEFINQDLDE